MWTAGNRTFYHKKCSSSCKLIRKHWELRHLAFKVKSVDDTVKELNGKGIETEPVRLDDYTGKKMTFFHDPDGLPLEIHE